MFRGKNILVTGATGFIASALVSRLVEYGNRVVGLVKDVDVGADPIGWRYVLGDVCDQDVVRRTISDNEIDTIYHLAASAIVRISARDPMTTYQTNVMGTVNVLEAARTVGRCESIVVASSDKAYGDHDILPYTEDHPLQPKNTYDTSKACMDMIARSYAHNYGMPIVVSRCSNVYGPGDMNLSRIIPNTIGRVLNGQPPVLYSDVENMEREFIFIEDVVDAYLLLADHANSFRGHAFNIGGAGPVRIRDLVKLICSELGRSNLEPEIIERDPIFQEIQRQYIDAKKLYSCIGWSPRVGLGEGILLTVRWYMRHFAEKTR